jgi:hypothetical protein
MNSPWDELLVTYFNSHALWTYLTVPAQLTHVRGMILGQTLKLTLIGVRLGLAGSFVLARFLASLLFGIGVYDPVTFFVVAFLQVTVALVASYIRAPRYARGSHSGAAVRVELNRSI